MPSNTVPPKTTSTPRISEAATRKASERFCFESVVSNPIGFCAPVMTTGFRLFCMRYESADAVYARVSVPCAITKPSNISYFSCMSAASASQCSGIISVLSSAKSCSASMSHIFETSGTSRSNSEAPRDGDSAPFVRSEAIVPPVPINSILFLMRFHLIDILT